MKVAKSNESNDLFVKISLYHKSILSKTDEQQEVEEESCSIRIGRELSMSEASFLLQSILPRIKTLLLNQLKACLEKKSQNSHLSAHRTSRINSKKQSREGILVTNMQTTQITSDFKTTENQVHKSNGKCEVDEKINELIHETDVNGYDSNESTFSDNPRDLIEDKIPEDKECSKSNPGHKNLDEKIKNGRKAIKETTVKNLSQTVKVTNANLMEMLKSKIKSQTVKSVIDLETRRQTNEANCKNLMKMSLNKTKLNVSSPNEFFCVICDKKLAARSSLKRHILLQHIQIRQKRFNCLKCRRVFSTFKSLKIHKNTHKNQLPTGRFSCEFCKKLFLHRSSYLVHARLSFCRKSAFSCEECGKHFTQETTYQLHVKKAHQSTREHFLKCNKCDQLFASKNGFRKHKLKATCISSFICQHCGRNFRRPNLLKAHLQSHVNEAPENGFRCKKCLRLFATQSGVEKHEKSCQSGVSTSKFQTVSSVMQSKKSTNYVCEQCGKSFTQSSTLHKHVRTHANIRPHKCDYCTKSFPDKFQLKIHTRIHTGEKPYLCNDCGKFFVCSGKLKRHMKTHIHSHQINIEENKPEIDVKIKPLKKRRNDRLSAKIDDFNVTKLENGGADTNKHLSDNRLDSAHSAVTRYDIGEFPNDNESLPRKPVSKRTKDLRKKLSLVTTREDMSESDNSNARLDNPSERQSARIIYQYLPDSDVSHHEDNLGNPTIDLHRNSFAADYNPHYTHDTIHQEYAMYDSNSQTQPHDDALSQFSYKVQAVAVDERVETQSYFNNSGSFYDRHDNPPHYVSDLNQNDQLDTISHLSPENYQFSVPPPPPYPGPSYLSNSYPPYVQDTVDENEFRLLDLNPYLSYNLNTTNHNKHS